MFMEGWTLVLLRWYITPLKFSRARLAQSVERKALNLVVVGSSPTVGAFHGLNAAGLHTVSDSIFSWTQFGSPLQKFPGGEQAKIC